MTQQDSVQSGEPKLSLTEQQLEAIAYCEQIFHTTGVIPSVDKLAQLFDTRPQTVKKWFENDGFIRALSFRGVDLRSDETKQILTPSQTLLVNQLLNLHDKRSVREKLKECGVTSQQYHSWLSQPTFQHYIRVRAEQLFASSDHEAYTALLGAVRGGDMKAIQMFFEMRGIYNPRVQIDMNIDMVLTRVVEIVARHVRDPNVLEAIATDIESIMAESAPVARRAIAASVLPSMNFGT